MKKILVVIILALFALSVDAQAQQGDTTYVGGGLEGFSYPAPRTMMDLTSLMDYLLMPYPITDEQLVCIDMNGDDRIDLNDVVWLTDYLLGYKHDDWWDGQQQNE